VEKERRKAARVAALLDVERMRPSDAQVLRGVGFERRIELHSHENHEAALRALR
jgi:hypothetical protein